MTEWIALGVALLAVYFSWRGLIVMNSTMRISALLNDTRRAQEAARALSALGYFTQSLALVYEGAQGDTSLGDDPTHLAHWLSARMTTIDRITEREIEAQTAVALYVGSPAGQEATAAIRSARAVTTKFDNVDPTSSDPATLCKLLYESKEAGRTLIGLADRFAAVANLELEKRRMQERRGKSWWRP